MYGHIIELCFKRTAEASKLCHHSTMHILLSLPVPDHRQGTIGTAPLDYEKQWPTKLKIF